MFVAAGLAMVVVGVALLIRPVDDVVQETQGHCDYLPCVTLTTTGPLLALAFVVLLAGILVLALGIRKFRQGG